MNVSNDTHSTTDSVDDSIAQQLLVLLHEVIERQTRLEAMMRGVADDVDSTLRDIQLLIKG